MALRVFNYEFYQNVKIFYKSESHNHSNYEMVSMHFPYTLLSITLLQLSGGATLQVVIIRFTKMSMFFFYKSRNYDNSGMESMHFPSPLLSTTPVQWSGGTTLQVAIMSFTRSSTFSIYFIIHHTAAVVSWYNFTSCNNKFYNDVNVSFFFSF